MSKILAVVPMINTAIHKPNKYWSS